MTVATVIPIRKFQAAPFVRPPVSASKTDDGWPACFQIISNRLIAVAGLAAALAVAAPLGWLLAGHGTEDQ